MNDNYNEDEWSLISSLPQMVGAAMAGSASSGLVGSTKEMFASVRNMMSARETYGQNDLIASLLPDLNDRKKAMDDAKANRTQIMDRLKERGVKSSEGLSELILDDSRKAIYLLKQKESEETVEEYRKWLLGTAMTVANAAKEGDFLGFGGERFSEKEQELYAKLETALS